MNFEKLREEFPVTRNRIFFDNARVAPLPLRAAKAAQDFLADSTEHGTANYEKWMQKSESARKLFAKLIHADTSEVAFVKNTSEGISIVANGVDWRRGDNVVIPDIEFPANVYPWWNLKRLGVETRMVKAVQGRVEFDDIVRQCDDRTRVISISSVECNSGFRTDLARTGAFCKDKGILFCVDAIQSLGALDMDVKKCGVDFLAADGHKWLLSVEGLGGFYVASDALEKIHPAAVGWSSVIDANNYMTYDFTLRPDARRFEEGSLNVMSAHMFAASLSLFHEAGMDAVEAHIMALGDLILENLRQRNIKIFSSTRPGERSGIISFTLETDLNALATYMNEKGVSLTIRDGLVRVSPHFYNTREEVESFFEFLDKFLNS